jgi:uncharacterized protein YnzC (UPF0291/DUF896 family)
MATSDIIKDDRTSEIAIFARLIKVDDGDLPRALARYILSIGFDDEDQARMHELAQKEQEGSLSAPEKEELQNYVKNGHLLALLQSKARRSLKMRKKPSKPENAEDTNRPTTSVVDDDFPTVGTKEWGLMNRRRAELIRKKNRQGLSAEERFEFDRLQRLCFSALEESSPSPVTDEEDLRRLREIL